MGDRHRQLDPGAPPGRRVGFTLVELMVVFMIISLLLSVLIPTINSLLGTVHKRRASALIAGLSNGALLYKTDHHYFPGQQYVNKLPGGGGEWEFTGSQFLAAAMYGYTFDDINTSSPRPVSTDFMDYEPRHLFTWKAGTTDERRNTISDMFPTPMPICYYPSRMGPTGRNQYKESDNSIYTNGAKGTGPRDTFANRIRHRLLETGTGNLAVMDRQFLLISPGRDRKYFTQDDINNFQCYSYSNE